MTFEIRGGRELQAALQQLIDQTGKTSAGRAAMRRSLTKAAEPLEAKAKQEAPKLTRDLEQSITTGTRLTRRQARIARKVGKSAVEVHVGTANPAAIPQEFGTFKERPQPFMGPAWDATQDQVFQRTGEEAWKEIEKTAQRAARKAARRK